jgi:hypothetical protein
LKDLEVGTSVPGTYDIAVDFIDMTDDRYLWVRATDARPGFEAVVGGHAVIGDEDADPRVARIVAIDDDSCHDGGGYLALSRPISTSSHGREHRRRAPG